MGIVRNPANTMRRGRVGETTYYISGGQQIARQALNGSNFGESARRSEAQQKRRVLWANLVNFYKASRTWMPKAFETKKRNQSDYNKFMQLNVNSSKVALTKSEAEAGACVVDGYLVSQGSLPSIEIIRWNNGWSTNIASGQLTISDTTTVGEFSEAIINANGSIRKGMQLSFVSYQQSVDALGTPRAICRCYEVTFDPESQVPLYASFPDFCASTHDGMLSTNDNISIGGFAYILSELTSTGLAVSTQQLITNNESLLRTYTSGKQLDAAVVSYGVDSEVVLSPAGTILQNPEEQPLYIEKININGTTYLPGSYIGSLTQFRGKNITIYMSRATDANVVVASAASNTGASVDLAGVTVNGKIITGTINTTDPWSGLVQSFNVDLSDGVDLIVRFDTSETGGDL